MSYFIGVLVKPLHLLNLVTTEYFLRLIKSKIKFSIEMQSAILVNPVFCITALHCISLEFRFG